jgi:hypothetical protein
MRVSRTALCIASCSLTKLRARDTRHICQTCHRCLTERSRYDCDRAQGLGQSCSSIQDSEVAKKTRSKGRPPKRWQWPALPRERSYSAVDDMTEPVAGGVAYALWNDNSTKLKRQLKQSTRPLLAPSGPPGMSASQALTSGHRTFLRQA